VCVFVCVCVCQGKVDRVLGCMRSTVYELLSLFISLFVVDFLFSSLHFYAEFEIDVCVFVCEMLVLYCHTVYGQHCMSARYVGQRVCSCHTH